MRLVAVTLVLALLSAPNARGADATCTVGIAGRRDVVLPTRQGTGAMPAVDVRLRGPDLDLSVSIDDSQVVLIRDANGMTWRTSHGSTRLDGPIQSRTLTAPVHVAQHAVFLSIDAIAELAGRRLVLVDRTHALLVPMDAAVPSPTAAAGGPSGSPARTRDGQSAPGQGVNAPTTG